MTRCLFSLLCVLGLMRQGAFAADEWPQFRGPGGQGQASAQGVPLRWSEQEHVVWKTALPGRGWSSPVVSGERIWLTTALDTPATAEQTKATLARVGKGVPSPQVASHLILKALCVDRGSGRLLRELTLFEVDEPVAICSVNSFASPTPALDGDRVYCDFGSWGTACLDAATGQVLWSRKLPVDHQVGAGSSLLVHGRLLILVRDGCDAQYVTALDKTTGETVWKSTRPPLAASSTLMHKAFSTPLALTVDGREQLAVLGAQWVASYDPASGRELWRANTGSSFSNASRPAYGSGLLFICTAYGNSVLLAIRPDGQGDVTETHVAWQTQRGVPKRSSPLLVGDELYLVSDNGAASCVDARTGAVHWSERLPGAYSASPVSAAGRLYFFNEEGTTTVLRPGRQFERLAENRLEGRIFASPAFVDRAVFLRTDTHLYRLEQP